MVRLDDELPLRSSLEILDQLEPGDGATEKGRHFQAKRRGKVIDTDGAAVQAVKSASRR